MTDPPIRYIWHEAPVPAGLPVTQIAGWLLCLVTGRVLICEHDDGTLGPAGVRAGSPVVAC